MCIFQDYKINFVTISWAKNFNTQLGCQVEASLLLVVEKTEGSG